MAIFYRPIVLRGELMNPNYNQTITVFNCLKATDNPTKKDIWQKTILHDCFFKSVIGKVEEGKTARMSNVYTVRVPKSESYLPYNEWSKIPKDGRESFFTFRTDDIVVKGECLDNISGKSPDTAAEVLKRNKPDAFVITAISDNTSHPCKKHYRVGG